MSEVHFHKPYEGCYDDEFPESVRCPEPRMTEKEARAKDKERQDKEYYAWLDEQEDIDEAWERELNNYPSKRTQEIIENERNRYKNALEEILDFSDEFWAKKIAREALEVKEYI